MFYMEKQEFMQVIYKINFIRKVISYKIFFYYKIVNADL